MSQKSILGAQRPRIKTDLRLSGPLVQQVEVICRQLGIPKNVFFVFAAAELGLRLSSSFPAGAKREQYVKILEGILQKTMEETKKTL